MPPFDGKAMAADVLAAVRDYVARAVAPLQAKLEPLEVRFTAVESRVAGMPDMILTDSAISSKMAEEIKRAVAEFPKSNPETIAEMLNERFAQMPKPKDGPPGKDADPQAIAALLRPWIAEEVSKTQEPMIVSVSSALAEEMRKEIAALPKAKDGKDADPEAVAALVNKMLGPIPVPKDGKDGRDAAQLEIAAAIDPERSYPRGTYAKHANGLWRAYEATDGMRGWECLVAGVAEVEVLCMHEREFKVVHTLSDGKEFAQTFELPVAIYRGVFVDGREYHRGDQVSWGAHQWHCNEPTTEKPIEGGKAWTLAVKRGRDGKEGPAGPPGKDRVVIKEKAA